MTARRHPRLKLLANTARPDRVSAATAGLTPLDSVPSPPSWLPLGRAREEWARVATVLTACKLLTAGNVDLLAQYCALHGRLAESWASGATPTAALIHCHRQLAVTLGLTAMNLPAPAAGKPNPFAKHGRR